jgi:hypothetical protein
MEIESREEMKQLDEEHKWSCEIKLAIEEIDLHWRLPFLRLIGRSRSLDEGSEDEEASGVGHITPRPTTYPK